MRVLKKDFRGGASSKLDENILGFSKAKKVTNFEFFKGGLKSGCPFSPQNLPFLGGEGVVDNFTTPNFDVCNGAVFHFKKFDFEAKKPVDKLVVFDCDFNMYYLNLYDEEKVFRPLNVKFNSKPMLVNYRLNSEDVLVMCSASDNMVVWDGIKNPEVVLDAPLVSSMCVHNERLFATTFDDNYEVAFSDDLDVANWTISRDGAGFVSMPGDGGKVLKVISYLGYIYIFRERGISRLSASGGQEDFYLSHLFVSGGKIFENTISVCGDRIVFVASDGIYSFDGASTYKILEDIGDTFKIDEESSVCFFDGKYFLSAKDHNAEPLLLVYAVETGDYGLYSFNGIVDMSPVVSDEYNKLYLLVCGADSIIYAYDEAGGSEFSSKYVSGLYDFDVASEFKTVRRVSVFAEVGENSSLLVVLYNEKGENYSISIESGQKDYSVFFSGKTIGYKFEAVNDVIIKSFSMQVN